MMDKKLPAAPERRAAKARATILSALLFALTAGCASRPDVAPYELGRAPASELVGLTQDEIVQRLGGNPSGEFYANSVSLEDGERVSRIALAQLGQGSCSRNLISFVRVQRSPDASPIAIGVFRQERFAGLTGSDDGALPLDAVLALSCVGRRRDETDSDAAALWVLYAPLIVILSPAIVVGAPGALAEAQRRRELWESVRLGEPLPGGAEGFVDAYGSLLQVERDDREIRIGNSGGFTITLRDDRVQSIDRGYDRCRLTPDAALDCR